MFNDTPVGYDRGNGETWKPRNYGGERFGNQSLRQALAHSNNVIAVKLLESIGIPAFSQFAAKTGLQLGSRADLSLALGTEEVTLRELVTAYAPLANGGFRPKPRTILRIYDRTRSNWTNNTPEMAPAVAPGVAYITTQMLKDVMLYGTARSLKKFATERPAAGKTGTTSDYRDAWFVGYTPQLLTGVWVGYDKPRPGSTGFTGGAIAAPIWGRFMRAALAKQPAADFPKQDDVVSLIIDPATGFLATPNCPQRRQEFFLREHQPTTPCPRHGGTTYENNPPHQDPENEPHYQQPKG